MARGGGAPQAAFAKAGFQAEQGDAAARYDAPSDASESSPVTLRSDFVTTPFFLGSSFTDNEYVCQFDVSTLKSIELSL